MGKHLFGTIDDDGLDGANGDDVIIGYEGNDALSGGNGNDVLIGDGLLATRVALVSMDGAGVVGDDVSGEARFSADGTKIIFQSYADNLIPGDTVGVGDIFVKDLITGTLTAISTAIPTEQEDGGIILSDGDSSDASLSGDGKYAMFTTYADNLLDPDPGNGVSNVVIRNLATGEFTLLSQAKNGTAANGDSGHASFSADSSKVVFETGANNLLASDGNGFNDILLKTLSTGTLRVVSTNADGDIANGDSHNASISANGQLVAFESDATNLSTADTNGFTDVYVKDLVTDYVTLVSSSKTGVVGNAASTGINFTADGLRAVFSSAATNLVAHDTNGHADIFIKDLTNGAIRVVSTNEAGQEVNGDSFGGVVSPDGTRIAFYSNASNLVAGDTNGVTDVFVKDLIGGDVVRVSIGNAGVQGDAASSHIQWSPDGTHLLFESAADNLTGDISTTTNVFVATLDAPVGGDDVLDGGSGNDTFLPGGGHDTITGDDGDDVALFHNEFDTLDSFAGGTGNDTLVLEGDYASAVTFNAGVSGIEAVDLIGQHNYNFITVAGNFDTAATIVVDGSSNDAAHSMKFNASATQVASILFKAGAGDDVLTGANGYNTFDMREGGNDTIVNTHGGNTMLFGDTFTAADSIHALGTLSLDGDYSAGVIATDATLSGIQTIFLGTGHNYALTLAGTAEASSVTINAAGLGAGHWLHLNAASQLNTNFQLTGAAGNDVLTTGGGYDTLDLTLGGNDKVSTGAGNDVIDFGATFNASDMLDAGSGNDVVYVSALAGTRGAVFSLNAANFAGVEELTLENGGAFDFATADNVVAAGQTLTIDGTSVTSSGIYFNGAAETDGMFDITGGAMADTLIGGAGKDKFELSNSAADNVNGGGGNDIIELSGFALNPATQLNGGGGNDVLELSGSFTLLPAQLTSIEKVAVEGAASITMVDADVAANTQFTIDATNGKLEFDGSAETNGSFKITLSGDYNTVTGGAGADIINGSQVGSGNSYSGLGGNDTITGGAFSDGISGGAGNDVLTGGGGADYMTGGSGSDTFKYTSFIDGLIPGVNGPERITDFDATSDKIDLNWSIVAIDPTLHIAHLDLTDLFAGNLASDLTSLGKHHAEIVVVFAGDMKGTYLAVDHDAVTGFGFSQDMFINITGATHLASFSTADFI